MAEAASSSGAGGTTLLLILPLPIYHDGDRRWIDRQAHNGIARWLDNFDRVILCQPALPHSHAPADSRPIDDADFDGRCRLVDLPDARSLGAFLKVLRPTIARIDRLIDESTHLSFAIGGLFGDWAAVAALRAAHKHRKASIWTDRVESQVTLLSAQRMTGLRRAYWTATALAMRHYERHVIRRSAVGLFHGADCFAAYSPFSPDPHLVHDIHLSESARITAEELQAKAVRRSGPLSIVYAGRVHPDKGPLDWIDALHLLHARGVDFRATWHGDGPQFELVQAKVRELGLASCVDFPGASQDRDGLMRRLRAADLFLFCHKTPESPRCLIEALISGTPIVGYGSSYSRDLIAHHGGGVLTEQEPAELADRIEELANDRERLSNLIVAAARDGHPFTDVSVFHHRSELIKAIA